MMVYEYGMVLNLFVFGYSVYNRNRCTIYVCTKGREPRVYNLTPDDEIIHIRRQSFNNVALDGCKIVAIIPTPVLSFKKPTTPKSHERKKERKQTSPPSQLSP